MYASRKHLVLLSGEALCTKRLKHTIPIGSKFKFVTHLVSDGVLSCPISNIEMKASSPMTGNSGPSLKTLLSYQYYDSKTC